MMKYGQKDCANYIMGKQKNKQTMKEQKEDGDCEEHEKSCERTDKEKQYEVTKIKSKN